MVGNIFKRKRDTTPEDFASHVITLDKGMLHILVVESDSMAQELHTAISKLKEMGYDIPPVLISTSGTMEYIQIKPYNRNN